MNQNSPILSQHAQREKMVLSNHMNNQQTKNATNMALYLALRMLRFLNLTPVYYFQLSSVSEI